jgi:hypothetical protein
MGTSLTFDSIDSISDICARIKPLSENFAGWDFYTHEIRELISSNSEVSRSIISDLSFLDKIEAVPSWSTEFNFKKIAISEKKEVAVFTLNTGGESVSRNISVDSTNSNDINQLNEDFYNFLEKHSAVFVWTLKHTDFEDGIENAPITEVKNYIGKNRFVTFSWLHSIYSNNQKDSDVIAALLRIIGMSVDNEDYDKLLPLVKAGLSDNSSKAQEAAIMVIEQWRSKNCLDAIQTATFHSSWIKEYAKQVEKELKKELELC